MKYALDDDIDKAMEYAYFKDGEYDADEILNSSYDNYEGSYDDYLIEKNDKLVKSAVNDAIKNYYSSFDNYTLLSIKETYVDDKYAIVYAILSNNDKEGKEAVCIEEFWLKKLAGEWTIEF